MGQKLCIMGCLWLMANVPWVNGSGFGSEPAGSRIQFFGSVAALLVTVVNVCTQRNHCVILSLELNMTQRTHHVFTTSSSRAVWTRTACWLNSVPSFNFPVLLAQPCKSSAHKPISYESELTAGGGLEEMCLTRKHKPFQVIEQSLIRSALYWYH